MFPHIWIIREQKWNHLTAYKASVHFTEYSTSWNMIYPKSVISLLSYTAATVCIIRPANAVVTSCFLCILACFRHRVGKFTSLFETQHHLSTIRNCQSTSKQTLDMPKWFKCSRGTVILSVKELRKYRLTFKNLATCGPEERRIFYDYVCCLYLTENYYMYSPLKMKNKH